MAQVRGSFEALYDNVDKDMALQAIMRGQLKELPRVYTKYFNVRTSDRKFERVVTYVPFSETATKGEGETYTFDTLRQGYTIYDLCINETTCTTNGLHITFERPDPDANFYPAASTAKIVLRSPNGTLTRDIDIMATGQISVE